MVNGASILNQRDKFVLCGFVLFTVLAVFLAQSLPRTNRVVVFGPPFSSQARVAGIVASAGGEILGGTGLSWAVIAHFDRRSFQSDLYERGAMFVGDAEFGIFCFGGGVDA